ncbi:hypothetical protein [Arcticibacter sp. MXS-1]
MEVTEEGMGVKKGPTQSFYTSSGRRPGASSCQSKRVGFKRQQDDSE